MSNVYLIYMSKGQSQLLSDLTQRPESQQELGLVLFNHFKGLVNLGVPDCHYPERKCKLQRLNMGLSSTACCSIYILLNKVW